MVTIAAIPGFGWLNILCQCITNEYQVAAPYYCCCSMPKTRTSNRTKRPGAVLRRAAATTSSAEAGGSSMPSNEEALVERVTERVLSGLRRELETLLPQPTASGSATAAHPDSDDDDCDVVPAAALPGDLLPDPPATVTSPQLPAYPLISLKLGSSVDAKIKSDITAFKYVPMQSLLKGMPQASKQVVLQFNEDGTVVQPSLNIAESQKGKHHLTIEQWTDLFFTFVAIITADHPEHAPVLMNYGHSIREMATRGMSWMFYDDEFRRLNNGNPATPWGELHTELYLRAYKTNTDKSVRANRPFPPKSNRQQQAGMCWEAKNNAGVCKRFNCPFRHSCTKCQGNHPVNRCRVGRPSHLLTNPNQNRKANWVPRWLPSR